MKALCFNNKVIPVLIYTQCFQITTSGLFVFHHSEGLVLEYLQFPSIVWSCLSLVCIIINVVCTPWRLTASTLSGIISNRDLLMYKVRYYAILSRCFFPAVGAYSPFCVSALNTMWSILSRVVQLNTSESMGSFLCLWYLTRSVEWGAIVCVHPQMPMQEVQGLTPGTDIPNSGFHRIEVCKWEAAIIAVVIVVGNCRSLAQRHLSLCDITGGYCDW